MEKQKLVQISCQDNIYTFDLQISKKKSIEKIFKKKNSMEKIAKLVCIWNHKAVSNNWKKKKRARDDGVAF